MVIFHSYVKLPEGKKHLRLQWSQRHRDHQWLVVWYTYHSEKSWSESQWGWDDIPYMKWKICSKPPTSNHEKHSYWASHSSYQPDININTNYRYSDIQILTYTNYTIIPYNCGKSPFLMGQSPWFPKFPSQVGLLGWILSQIHRHRIHKFEPQP